MVLKSTQKKRSALNLKTECSDRDILLIIFFELPALSTYPGTWYESRSNPFVKSLHFSSAFWMIAFWMLNIWHNSCIQLTH